MPPRMTLSPTPVERRLHARRSARVVCAAVLLGVQLLQSVLAAPSAMAAGADADCVEALLRRMGWRIEQASIAAPVIARGLPCTRGTLVQAQQAGDLHAVLPAQWNAQQRGDALRALLDDPATQCAYAFELGAATQRAVRKLQDNPRYRFSAVQLGWIGFGWRGAAAQGWSGFKSFGRGYQPSGSNAQALDAFYRGQVRSECGVGRQVAQLATQRELYGDAGFDTVFSAGELSIGTFLTLHDTDSILLGAHAGEFFADGKAVKTAQLGRQAFVGAPGFIAHVFDKAYLDDIHNQAENFVVVDVSDAAAQALARRGGFAYYDARNRQIWELAKELRGPGRRRFERLLYERDAALRASLDAHQQARLQELLALLDDPFYQGFQVYVHPKGVKPIGYHVARLLDRNPRTPYAIDLTLHNLRSTLYWRWIDWQLQQCAAGHTLEQSIENSATPFYAPRGTLH
ncbi:hypothetical protein ABFU27_02245 [Xanthomonas campestris pv. raphani]|uniref:hypothetical protein n=1 Tax=Xanthomonas campestris TaxID=339 RepID=UPI001E54D656|nr:hypothetical protein [Xanthomonas campestris]MCC8484565.1 hypothetical protein [Xanthomonas campestris]MEA9651734.1 hypothetical protein [Xanthomonas campestris pv. raphani]MEA9736773.1 hypothetical protein [Xanthomonas campestris pv. raphani]MEA9744576.1 hypothetical protein [Xanthomonas campestris pv. raphani]MEA9760948.1 hypothetical protein [Xanthomonas campestris pv. raphani]